MLATHAHYSAAQGSYARLSRFQPLCGRVHLQEICRHYLLGHGNAMRVCVFGDVTWVGLVSYVILGCNARRQINHIMQVHVLRVCMCRRGHACAEKRGRTVSRPVTAKLSKASRASSIATRKFGPRLTPATKRSACDKG